MNYIEKTLNINYLYPGLFFPELSSEKVTSTKIPTHVPADCYGFYFTETEIAHIDGKTFPGKSVTVGKTYIIGKSVFVDDIPDVDRILKTNIRNNSPTKTGIKTHLGNWQQEDENTISISPDQFTFTKPTFYKNVGVDKSK